MDFQIEAIKPDLFEGREFYEVFLKGRLSKVSLGELVRVSKFNVVSMLPVGTEPPKPKKTEEAALHDGSGSYD